MLTRIAVFAVLSPALVAATDQLLFDLNSTQTFLIPWLYPWIIFSAAILSWTVGRYRSPALLLLLFLRAQGYRLICFRSAELQQ